MRQVSIKLLLLLTGILFANSLQAQGKDDVRVGKLPNGFTYYLSSSKDFPDEVNLYLLQNVGAILEEDHQNGLAHYLEHMAFNTTAHFPQGVMKYLRSNSHYTFNAFTGLNETRYFLYSLPANDTKTIDAAFNIVLDWCQGITITPEDVDKERGIIIEEWRQRHDVFRRLQDHIAPVIYNHSKYAERNVIGDVEVLKSFTAKDLKEFYQTWYRPDLQALVVVGDFDIAAYEAKIKELFSPLKMPKQAPKRYDIVIEDNPQPLYTHFVDPEMESLSNSFGIYQRYRTDNSRSGVEMIKENLYTMIFNQLVSQRIGMIRNSGEESFLAATINYAPLVRHYSQLAIDVVPYEGKSWEALEQILALREQFRREGFAEAEFTSVQESIYEDLESLLESDNLGTPDNVMEVFKQHYLYQVPIKPFREQLEDNVEVLVEMTVEEFNAWVRGLLHDQNISFATYSSTPEQMEMPVERFNTLLAEVKEKPLLAFKQPTPITQMIDFPITKGSVVSSKPIEEVPGAEEWQLSNGARLLYAHLPQLKEMVFFVGTAMGGRSIITPEELPAYDGLNGLMMKSGVYKYDRNQLALWLSDKTFDLNISLKEYTDDIGGMTRASNLEDMLAYTHLILTKHNFTQEALDKYVEQQSYLYKSRGTSEMTLAQDSIQRLLYPITPDNPVKDLAFYRQIKLDDVTALFDKIFGNAGHFTFCIAGDIERADAITLTEKYIASLPGVPGTKPRTFKVMDLSSPEPLIKKTFEVDVDGEIGQVELAYINDIALNEREEKALKVLQQLLDDRLFDELREKESGTYNVGVAATYFRIPTPSVSLSLRFETDRERVDYLKSLTLQILDEVKRAAYSDDQLKRARIPLAIEEQAEQPAEGEESEAKAMMTIALLNMYMESQHLPEAYHVEDTATVSYQEITRDDITAVANRLFDGAKVRDIVLKSLPPERREWKH